MSPPHGPTARTGKNVFAAIAGCESRRQRPEFEGANAVDKLGGALPARRPLDSAVSPGFIAAGDSAGHVNSTTGGGIPGAAKSAHWASERAIDAIGAIGRGSVSSMGVGPKLETSLKTFGHWETLLDLYRVHRKAGELAEHYDPLPRDAQRLRRVAGRP